MKSIGQVFPRLSLSNSTSLGSTNSKKRSDLRPWYALFRKASDLTNLIWSQLRHGMSFPVKARIATTTLLRSITHVIQMRTYEQVIGIDAFSIVTFMANMEAFRDWTKVNFPRNSMRLEVTTKRSKSSVPHFVNSALPIPTFIPLARCGILPKAYLWCRNALCMSLEIFCGLSLYSSERRIGGRIYQGGLATPTGA